MNFINRIKKFMYNRYGADDLYNFLFKIYITLLIIDLFIKFNPLIYFELFLLLIILYRFFSKNLSKRREENRKFLKIKNKITSPIKKTLKQIKDKNNIYKKCPKCKTILRLPLPNQYGIKHVKCPKCKRKLTVFCFKKEKIEIIKNKKGVK